MTALAAHLRHRTPGRTRLEIPALKGSPGGLSRIANEMANLIEGVHTVKMNASLGTLTVYHAPHLMQELPAMGRSRDWFHIEEDVKAPAREITQMLRGGFREIDAQLRVASGNRVSGKTLLFFSLAGLALVQVRRGKVLPAGLTLFMQAQAFMDVDDAE